MSTRTESVRKPDQGHGNDHQFRVAVRSLAGHSDKVTVKPSNGVGEVRDKEVKHFIAEGWLTAGDLGADPAEGLAERARPDGHVR